MNSVINDNFQTKVKEHFTNIEQYGLFADIVLYGLIGFTYYYGDNVLYAKLIKYVLFMFLLRYVLDSLTSYKLENKKSYQINSQIAIFSMILLLSNTMELNMYTLWTLLWGYALFVSSVGYGFTTNNIMTLYFVYFMIQYRIV